MPETKHVKTVLDVFNRLLKDAPGGRVLDVATGQGGFIGILKKSLKDYAEIVGVDVSEQTLEVAREAHPDENIHFLQMDTARLGLPDENFDTVSIGVSLHHLLNVPQALTEMLRVLRSGGRCIISEMYRDGQTEPQRTVVAIHDWAAEVDATRGVTHHPTFTRAEIVAIVTGLGLRNLVLYDYANLADPKAEAAIKGSLDAIDRVLERAEGRLDYAAFERRAEALRHRVHDVGVQTQTALIAVGEKAG